MLRQQKLIKMMAFKNLAFMNFFFFHGLDRYVKLFHFDRLGVNLELKSCYFITQINNFQYNLKSLVPPIYTAPSKICKFFLPRLKLTY